jgi:hypothetical protein
MRADSDSRLDSLVEAFEGRRADDEVATLAAERIRDEASERTEDGAQALRDLGVDVQ